jgi:E3 ubiquitin-protein ligase MARCH6
MGSPIPCPPEGWDDLGLGGAEDQGCWAWGNEKKSETEISVAKRRPFFNDRGKGLHRWANNVGVVLKVAGILVLSWLVIMVVVSSALNLPLVLGRCSLYLLRVPEKYMHDPLAFAIGGCISVPFVSKLSQILRSCKENAKDRSCLGFYTFVKWISSFKRPHSWRKVAVLFGAGLLWFAVAPTIIGSLYDLLLMKSSSWWEWKETLIGRKEVAEWWGTGLFLLNVWAAFCYFGIGTKEFWIEVIGPDDADNQDRNRDLNQARNAVPVEAEQNENHEDDQVVEENITNTETSEMFRGASTLWQGPEGRIAEFIRVWNRVLLKWEWDKIDHVTLLKNCALPIVQNSGSVLCISLLAVIGSALLLDIYAGSRDTSGFKCECLAFLCFHFRSFLQLQFELTFTTRQLLQFQLLG